MTAGVVMLDVAGLSLSPEDERLLKQAQVGGVILFSRNFSSVQQLSSLVTAIRGCSPNVIIAVDHEGGRVQRFKQGFTRIPAMQSFLADYRQSPEDTLAWVQDVGWVMASELIACGIDISFAPVLDVDDQHCAVIADRSFSPVPNEVVALAAAFMAGMHQAGMATTGKHFPGHGSVTGDSHLVQPVDNRSLEDISAHDLIPFRRLLPALDALMPAHIVFPQVDALPVGFSTHWLQRLLREEMGFNGVIFSDDLSMAGAESAGSYAERADAALEAGCDMVLVCNQREAAQQVVDHLTQQGQPGNERIAAMRARKRCHWEDLFNNPRWQRVNAELTTEAVEG